MSFSRAVSFPKDTSKTLTSFEKSPKILQDDVTFERCDSKETAKNDMFSRSRNCVGYPDTELYKHAFSAFFFIFRYTTTYIFTFKNIIEHNK
jgi:hypothetical protein